MRRQGIKPTVEKPPDTYLEYKIKTNVVFCTTTELSTTKGGRIYSYLCGCFPIKSSRVNKYIYAMYVYYCNTIMTTTTKNISDK